MTGVLAMIVRQWGNSYVIQALKTMITLIVIGVEVTSCLYAVGLGFAILDHGFARWFPLQISGALAGEVAFPTEAGIVDIKAF
jgi:hypothetical protein